VSQRLSNCILPRTVEERSRSLIQLVRSYRESEVLIQSLLLRWRERISCSWLTREDGRSSCSISQRGSQRYLEHGVCRSQRRV